MSGGPPDLHAENQLLRDFYDAWVFFHAVRNDPSESEAWNKVRLQVAAQTVVDTSNKVKLHIQKHTVQH